MKYLYGKFIHKLLGQHTPGDFVGFEINEDYGDVDAWLWKCKYCGDTFFTDGPQFAYHPWHWEPFSSKDARIR